MCFQISLLPSCPVREGFSNGVQILLAVRFSSVSPVRFHSSSSAGFSLAPHLPLTHASSLEQSYMYVPLRVLLDVLDECLCLFQCLLQFVVHLLVLHQFSHRSLTLVETRKLIME